MELKVGDKFYAHQSGSEYTITEITHHYGHESIKWDCIGREYFMKRVSKSMIEEWVADKRLEKIVIINQAQMKIGQNVTIVVKTPFAKTEEPGVIETVSAETITIVGLEHSSFSKINGKKSNPFPGSSVYIKEIYEEYINSLQKR